MNASIRGQRPRPRVALIGEFEPDDIDHFTRMFPTIWSAGDMDELSEAVDVREIDLIIIGPDIDDDLRWSFKTHVICFSNYIDELPGPIPPTILRISGDAETEGYVFPDVPLPISHRREADYKDLASVRGWPRITLTHSGGIVTTILEAAGDIFSTSAVICEHQTNSPLAVYYMRKDANLGVAWLPSVDKNRAEWVELLVTEWADIDEDAFPNFKNWTESPEWMVPEEEEIISKIENLKKKKHEIIKEIDNQVNGLSTELDTVKLTVNNGRRRLITAQGPELMDEVMKALDEIGFKVTLADDQIAEGEPKREDLRLNHPEKTGEDWNAIVEVRGYKRSPGNTQDLLRLGRFADLYQRETGQFPDKRIYIVNGQLELKIPSQRQEPLAAASGDLEVFSDSGGILIWSIDLFRALKMTDSRNYPALLESIKQARGRWIPGQA